jgi:hypothetical protein
MRKFFTLIVLLVIAKQYASAQKVTDTYINFRELAAYEAAHPEIFKLCEICPKKESDNWEALVNPNMPFPPGAIIKTNGIATTNPIQPDAPSRAPIQNWQGHVDPAVTIPPDTHGAVGPNHVVSATNNYIKIHNKIGGAQISQVTISTFTGVSGSCDPYLKYDPSTNRWMFSAINCSMSSLNPMILMVSNTSDPTGTWRKITWVPAGVPMLLDHPYLGFDNRWIVLSGRRFAPSFQGSSLFIIDKADMLAGNTITWGGNAQQIDKTNGDGDCPLPVTVYEPPYSNVGNPSPGTFYVLQSWNSSSIRLTTVTGNIPTATWNTGSGVFPSGGTPWNAGGLGNVAEQTIETRKLAANDARISCGVMMNGKIWCVQHIGFPTSGTADRVALQWWQLDGSPGGSFGNVLQRGRVGGNNPNEYKWFPSIAVNKDEDVLIGYTASTNTSRVSAAYVTRQASTPVNTTDDEYIYKAGVDRYWKDFSSGRARWGDYSHTALDPSDGSLWTIQEYAEQGAGPIPPDNNSRYGVWWAQVGVSAPPVGYAFTSPAPTIVSCPPPASMNVSLGTVSNGGFSDPITLSASGNPAGTTVSFSANPVVPGNSSVVTLNNTSNLTYGTYTVTITGTTASAPTQTRDVVFIVSPGAAPAIGTQPASQTVCTGANVTFTVAATGALTYQWQISTNGGGSFTDIAGATTTSYSLTGVTAGMNANQYRVIVSGQCNSSTSAAAILTVNSSPSISTQPQNATICAGSNNTFSVAATGTGLLYQWQLSTNGGGIFNDIAGATATSYAVNAATVGMSGYQYRVVINGTCTPPATSTAATLTVVAAVTVSAQPADVTVCEPGNTSFTSAGTGSGVIYQWQVSTDGGANYTNVSNGGVYSGAGTATLTITGATASMNGYRYRTQMSNATCTTPVNTNGAILTVNTVPAVTTNPQSVTVCTGTNNTFISTATGSGLTYQWQVSTDGGANYTDIPGATSSSYTLTGITVGMNNNRYRVVVSGACTPPAVSNAAVLTAIAPVAVTTQPASAAICETGNVSFSVVATSAQPITYQWQVSTNGGGSWSNIPGETSATLNITNVTPVLNNNQYRVLMTNPTCSSPIISNVAVLTVNARPTVTLSASPVTSLFPGLTTTLTATILPSAAGFNISWFQNGVLLPGVTGTTYNVDVTKLGLYRVDIVNPTTGCNNTSENLLIKDSASSRLFIYPSPNDGQFTVSYYNSAGGNSTRTVTAFDAKGAKVYEARFPISGPYTLFGVDLRPAQTGIYLVVIGDGTGKRLAEGKVLVH